MERRRGQREWEQEQGKRGGGSRWRYGSGGRGCDAAVGTESVVVGVDGSIVVEAEGAGRWRGQSAG